MKRKLLTVRTKLIVDGIEGFFIRKVTNFGTSAKVDCPKQYLGRTVYLAICKESGKEK